MPASTGIAPASRSAPKIVYALESRTWPNSGVSVGGISSSPVRQHDHARPRMHERRAGSPAFASSPSSGAPEALAALDEHGALGDVLADGAHVRPAARPRTARTTLAVRPRRSRSARSCRRPRGSARRSRSRTASPPPTVASGRWPISARPTIFSSAGRAGVALGDVGRPHREPVHRRGRERGQARGSATTSSAEHAPVRLGERELQRSRAGWIASSTRSRASSTGISPSAES